MDLIPKIFKDSWNSGYKFVSLHHNQKSVKL